MLNSIPLSYTSLTKIKTGPDAIAAEMQINAIKKVLAVGKLEFLLLYNKHRITKKENYTPVQV